MKKAQGAYFRNEDEKVGSKRVKGLPEKYNTSSCRSPPASQGPRTRPAPPQTFKVLSIR